MKPTGVVIPPELQNVWFKPNKPSLMIRVSDRMLAAYRATGKLRLIAEDTDGVAIVDPPKFVEIVG